MPVTTRSSIQGEAQTESQSSRQSDEINVNPAPGLINYINDEISQPQKEEVNVRQSMTLH